MTEKSIALIGARSLVGKHLIPMLAEDTFAIHALTRSKLSATTRNDSYITWHTISAAGAFPEAENWVSMIPLWELLPYLQQMEPTGIKRLIAFSSTSRIAKENSDDAMEQALAMRLADAEKEVASWAKRHAIKWTVLRPTLIYDPGRDKNITAIARFIKKFGFFPVVGTGNGLRMPVSAEDLAIATMHILALPDVRLNHYNLAGKDALTYHDMVVKIFEALHRKPRILHVPAFLLAFAIRCARILPKFRHLTPGIATRMQKDQIFSYEDAAKDFSYAPRPFAVESLAGYNPNDYSRS